MSSDGTDRRPMNERDLKLFGEMKNRFGAGAWPNLKTLAGHCKVTERVMKLRLVRFVALGLLGVGPRDTGPWIEHLKRPTGPPREVDDGMAPLESRRDRAGLPVKEVEERIAKLRAARQEAHQHGRIFNGDEAIKELDR
jgi:hypothetical protein